MKIQTKKKTPIYFTHCELCKKAIRGTSESQVRYNLKTHEMIHKDNFKELQGIKLDFSKKKEVKKK